MRTYLNALSLGKKKKRKNTRSRWSRPARFRATLFLMPISTHSTRARSTARGNWRSPSCGTSRRSDVRSGSGRLRPSRICALSARRDLRTRQLRCRWNRAICPSPLHPCGNFPRLSERACLARNEARSFFLSFFFNTKTSAAVALRANCGARSAGTSERPACAAAGATRAPWAAVAAPPAKSPTSTDT